MAFKVEAAFGYPAAETSVVWTDITDTVYSVKIERGRESDFDQFYAGTAEIVLDNSSGDYDPFNSAGAYYDSGETEVLPNVRVRVSDTHSATTYYLFTGFVDSWLASYDLPEQGYSTVVATDGFKLAARNTVTAPAAAGEKAGERIGDILDIFGWPAAWRDLDTGITTLAEEDWERVNALQEMQRITETEGGSLYIDGEGDMVLVGRHDFLLDSRHITTQVTFDDAESPDAGSIRFRAPVPVHDESLIRNIVRVAAQGSDNVYEAVDTASATQYGELAWERTGLAFEHDPAAESAAEYYLALYKDPQPRVESLIVDVIDDSADAHLHAIARQLLDRCEVKFTPPGGGDRITQTGHITRIIHLREQGAQRWVTEFGISADATLLINDADEWLILNDATAGKLNTGKLGY